MCCRATVALINLLRSLRVKSTGRKFRLASSQVIERKDGIIGIEVNGIQTRNHSSVRRRRCYLLGGVTLEELGLEVDPVKGELKPLELVLM
ncbi:MAG: hypothetical protein QXT33_06095 [Thermofilum sp.]